MNENNGRPPMPGSAMNPAGPARVIGKLTREEVLEMEVLSLKTQNLGLQEKQLQQDLIQANKMRQELQTDLSKRTAELGEKYKISMLSPTTRILPDGTIIDSSLPPTQASPPAPQRSPRQTHTVESALSNDQQAPMPSNDVVSSPSPVLAIDSGH